MERDIKIVDYKMSFDASITVQAGRVGEDIHLLLFGGEKPHIGCVVMAIPRPSLLGNGMSGATSSVLNVLGHKDEGICRLLAEEVCKAQNRLTICAGGFHVDHLSIKQIEEVKRVVKEEVLPRLIDSFD